VLLLQDRSQHDLLDVQPQSSYKLQICGPQLQCPPFE
jgi:hypothetical protein